MDTKNLLPSASTTRSDRLVSITIVKIMVIVGALAVIWISFRPTANEAQDWQTAQTTETTLAYREFHRNYPDSTRLRAITADVECSQNLTMSSGGFGTSGTASLSSLNVIVYGHPELSGQYRANESGTRSLIERYTELGGTVGMLAHARLLVADVKGRPRIVAIDGH